VLQIRRYDGLTGYSMSWVRYHWRPYQ